MVVVLRGTNSEDAKNILKESGMEIYFLMIYQMQQKKLTRGQEDEKYLNKDSNRVQFKAQEGMEVSN